jgi:hypothetical protein
MSDMGGLPGNCASSSIARRVIGTLKPLHGMAQILEKDKYITMTK